MADPATLALMAAGVSAATSITAGFAAKGAADFNADIAERNAKLARERGEARAAENARRTRLAVSARRAGAAARGVEFTGTALDLAAEEAIQGELQTRFIAHGAEIQAKNQIIIGRQERMRGRIALATSFARAGSTLLSGASEAGSMAPPGTGTT